MRPPRIVMAALNFIGIPFVLYDLRTLLRHAVTGLNAGENTYIPVSERPKALFWARIHIAIYAATVLLALPLQSFLPLMLIGGPLIYGCWHTYMTGLIQHGGQAEDVVDHRLNSRTVYMNPVSRWIYWNMNYRVEHHMFPMVPFHAPDGTFHATDGLCTHKQVHLCNGLVDGDTIECPRPNGRFNDRTGAAQRYQLGGLAATFCQFQKNAPRHGVVASNRIGRGFSLCP